MNFRTVLAWGFGLFGAAVVAPWCSGGESIDFNRDIRPLLSNRCLACHGPDEAERKADLRLDTREGATADLGGYAAVAPGQPDESELVYRLATHDEADRMPPPSKGDRFTEEEIDLVRRWIEQGAEYAKHWSYQQPERVELPAVENESWSSHPVDRFVLARLEKEGLEPSPRADRLALARRVALDLTGLPPTWEQARAFQQDERDDAYRRYVERLMDEPAFGEHWARMWLDLARYADSAGYADDPLRTIWAYRDYVIRSFNENKPFDEFTIEQIAGDLLEDPEDHDLVATAFHRNTMTNNEGGTNDEEFRNVAVVDRVNTTMSAWMGTTMACAQCHTHKYDPLTQTEYFQLFDFFNQTADADRKDETPVFDVWTDAQKEKRRELERSIAETKETLATDTPALVEEREQWMARWSRPIDWRTVVPADAGAESAKLTVDESGAVTAEPAKPRDVYRLEFDFGMEAPPLLSALKLEVPAEQERNFVLSRVSAWVEPKDLEEEVKGRYVRIELPGKSKRLHLAEIEVLDRGRNVARGAKAKASSVHDNADPARAVDGNTDGRYRNASVFHTRQQDDPWIEIDLGSVRNIDAVALWNRTDGGSEVRHRLADYRVRVLDADRNEVFSRAPETIPAPSHTVSISGRERVRFASAIASHEQEGFPASAVLEGPADAKKGWAIAGGAGREQELTLVFDEPFETGRGSLKLALEQRSEHDDHLLRHFRLAATGESRISRWAAIPADVRGLLRKDGDLTEAESNRIATYFRTVAPSLETDRKRLTALEKELASLKPHTTVPVMRRLPPDERRDTHVQIRGNYKNTGERVEAGVPDVFHPLPEDQPRNRLGLAHWLVDEDNPLTARVVANRFWEKLFGIGLVETSEEFGSQGTLPSHPELLDWLAVELMESGWDMKEFLALLVTSETYRQSAAVSSELQQRDPYNRLLARGPRFRITAETVRDQALAVSGLLSDRRFGPPVRPPKPDTGLKAAFGSKTDWETSEGENRYRRAVYTQWRRSTPYPSMATFDAPNRESCTVRRTRTNTPLQALVTLNDPVYVEAAQAWGRRAAAGEGTVRDRLAERFRKTLIRAPKPHELDRLTRLYREARERYADDTEAARRMAEEPLGAIPEGAEPAEMAAWTVVGNVVLNLDEMFLKR